MTSSRSHGLERIAPALFVLLWSTGFIVARYGTRDAGPLTFLTIRTAIAVGILFVLAVALGETHLRWPQIRMQLIIGLGIHAFYLGGLWVAIDLGLPSGVGALIAALHPVLTTVLGRYTLNELITARQGVGIALGCVGVIAVVVERGVASDGISAAALLAMATSILGMSIGTLIQRKFAVNLPILQGTAWQYVSATLALGVGAVVVEGWNFSVTYQSVLSLAWSVGVLSVVAILIMLWLLQRQAASRVSSLFFLTPALSTVEGAILFGERLGVLSALGLLAAVIGVWLATANVAIPFQRK